MALLGTGVLAIWNGIAAGQDEEFLEWHVREHLPERVGLPGFLRGRRYAALGGDPAFFNFYEVEAPAVLRSPAYLARLNDPTPWTRKVLSAFTDTSRTLCRVEASAGMGVGSLIEVLRFENHDDRDSARIAAFVAALLRERGIVGVHVLRRDDGPSIVTSESRLRGIPDLAWAAVLLVEAVDRDAVTGLRSGALADDALRGVGFSDPAARGLYQLQFCLDATELLAGGPGARAEP